jgi:hypothetical protein
MTFTDLSAFITGQGEETYRRVGVGGKRIGGSAYRRVGEFVSRASVLSKKQNGTSPLNENADTPTRRYVSPEG